MLTTTSPTQSFFEGFTFEFVGADGKHWRSVVEDGKPVLHELVETHDGTIAHRDECERVWKGHSRVEFDWYDPEQLRDAQDCGAIAWVETRGEYWYDAYVVADEDGDYIHEDDAVDINGYYYHRDSDCVRYDHRGDPFHAEDDDYCYVESEGEWYHNSECHWSDEDDTYHAGDQDCCDECCSGEDRINEYHQSPRASLFRGTSPFLVGFEVEKNSVGGASSRGDYVDIKPLFAGWERDASCGVEGITHAYDPLDAEQVKRFRQDLLDSADYVNEPCDSSCGGHINISSSRHTPRELMSRFKQYAPLWFAVYRNRLNNSYCRNDKKIEHGGDKYSPVRTKDFGIEIRLPNRVHNATVLQRRFDWVGLTCEAMDVGFSYNAYVKGCRDVLLNGAYNGDRNKYAMILRLARKFRVWMLDGIAHPSIHQWI